MCLLSVLIALLCSCDQQGNAQSQSPPKGGAEGSGVAPGATKLERISSSEIGKLRSRVGKEVIVFGKVSGTSQSGSGHHFLNFSSGFKIVCLKDHVGKFGEGGPASLFRGKLIEVRGEVASHKGKPQIALEKPGQIKVIELGKGGAAAEAKKFELVEVGPDTWMSPAGLRYKGRDAKGLTRKAHVLRHAKDQPKRAGSHGVFDANGDAVFKVVDEAWVKAQRDRIRPRTEGDSQTYLVPMGRRVGYLGGQNGARQKNPVLKSVFIVVRRGTKDVVTAFPR